MLKNIMRSLGYVPLAVATDLNNEVVRVERDYATAVEHLRKEIATIIRQRDEAEKRAETEAKRRINDAADHAIVCKNYDTMLKKSARLVSVYVIDGTARKETRLMVAATDKEGNNVAVPVRKLVLNKKNRETLIDAAKMIAVSFGIAHTTVDFVSPKIGV